MSTATRSRRLRSLLLPPLALALAEAAAGCASGPPPSRALQQQELLAAAGAKAWARGDLPAAIDAEARALRAARAVEDVEGVGLRILDLAALRRAAGEPAEARAALEELLAEPPPLPFPPRWRAEAARLAGLLALDGGDAAAASRWGERARELCRAAKCPPGAVLNLQARAALAAGDPQRAGRLAAEALAASRKSGEAGEQANAARIAADAHLAGGRPAAAARSYETALALDKRLGRAEQVRLDLVGLGRAAAAEGRGDDARRLLERARAAALAAGDAAGAAEVEALIGALAPAAR